MIRDINEVGVYFMGLISGFILATILWTLGRHFLS